MPIRTLRNANDVIEAMNDELLTSDEATDVLSSFISHGRTYQVAEREEDEEANLADLVPMSWSTTAAPAVFVDTYPSSGRRRDPMQNCIACGEHFSPALLVENATWIRNGYDDGLVCSLCFSRHYRPCGTCQEPCHVANSETVMQANSDRTYYCVRCFENVQLNHCGGCGRNFALDNPHMVTGNRCEECMNMMRETGQILYRRHKHDEKLIGKKRGAVIKSLRPFGIELEAVYESSKKASKMSTELPAFVGVGQDASIQGGDGIEVQTPPSNGLIAEDMIADVCKMMSKATFVNQSCGYHLHIDVADVDELEASRQVHALKAIWLGYLAFEDVLLSFLPPSRKTNMRYCAPLRSEYSVDEIIRTENMDQLEQLWYRMRNKDHITRAKTEHHHQSRYRGINLHPMFSGRHLEIRYHSGTLNTTKIIEWANLHTAFVDHAVQNLFDMASFKNLMVEPSLAVKTQKLFDKANLKAESRGYFLARQEAFKVKEKPKADDDHFKAGMKLLEAEKEI